jgi:hypothetical protein
MHLIQYNVIKYFLSVLPPGFEPGITVSKTVVISTSLQEHFNQE